MLFLLKRTFWMYYYECKIINKSTILVKQNKEGSESGQAYTTTVNYFGWIIGRCPGFQHNG